MTIGVHRSKVRLEPYDPAWKDEFIKEKQLLESLLDKRNIIEIMHVGSTSIPGIMSKPLIDILVVVKNTSNAREWVPFLESEGYHLREDVKDHLMLARGPEENRTAHLHIGERGERYIDDTIIFKEYLLENPTAAKDYERLKIKLANKYPNDRKSYSPAKNDFIQRILKSAREGLNWGEL